MAGEIPGSGRRVCGGRFELRERLGSGAMGTVWRALDTTLHREVALKEVRVPEDATAEDAATMHARALREARALARLRNPHVVTVHQVAEDEPFPWIVMELVPGRPLSAVLAEGPMTPQAAAEIGTDILDALTAAHGAGVLHRDVKPANVVVRPDGRAVLVDFGIAAVEGVSSVTATGSVIGTLEYVAPERVTGQQPSPSTDLWSLGVLLYVAVEGRSPFGRANEWATLAAIVNDPHPPPHRSGPLAGVIDALLAKDPAARPDAAEAAARLAAAGRLPDTAPTVVTAPRTPPAPPPHPPTTTPYEAATRTGPPVPLSVPPPPHLPLPEPPHRASPSGSAPGRSRNLLIGIAVGALLVGGGTVAALTLAGGGKPPTAERTTTPATTAPSAGATGGTTGPTAPGTADRTTAGPSTGSTAPGPTTTGPATTGRSAAPSAATLPTGYQLRTHSTGFTVAVPVGWKETRDKSGNPAYESPDGTARLVVRVLRGDVADPYAEQLRSANETAASASYPGYRRIALTEGTRGGGPEATWEYAYSPPEGKRHIKDTRWRVGTTGYNLWIAAPDGPAWPQYAEQLDIALAHFRDTGAAP